jgi:hypothetical protein
MCFSEVLRTILKRVELLSPLEEGCTRFLGDGLLRGRLSGSSNSLVDVHTVRATAKLASVALARHRASANSGQGAAVRDFIPAEALAGVYTSQSVKGSSGIWIGRGGTYIQHQQTCSQRRHTSTCTPRASWHQCHRPPAPRRSTCAPGRCPCSSRARSSRRARGSS